VTIRRRADADLPALVGILEAQRPTSGYPVRWPLPFPAEEFIARRTELAAWVAVEPGRDGAVVGHVSLTGVAAGWDADGWGAGTGLPASALAAVSVLFVDPLATGRGVGGTLLATAVDHARGIGRTPVLDVVSESRRAVALYTRHGWQVVGRARPPWLPTKREPLLLMALPSSAPLSSAPLCDPLDPAVTQGERPGRRR
jgi:GNAT superfamily N-acetyltransferase